MHENFVHLLILPYVIISRDDVQHIFQLLGKTNTLLPVSKRVSLVNKIIKTNII